ncbi:MAG: hypothetical protein JSS50_00585 [Proteobacteria bacterium]|nr:hypothetical protein [Pseudomonadota bacterium]
MTDSNNFRNAVNKATDYISQTSQSLVERTNWPVRSQDKGTEVAAVSMRAAFEMAAAVIEAKTDVLPKHSRLSERSESPSKKPSKNEDQGYSR